MIENAARHDAASPLAHETPEVHVSIRGLDVTFQSRRGVVRAVDGVDLDIRRGRVLAVVGESGSGKSTIAKALIGLVARSGGSIRLGGVEQAPARADRPRESRASVQMIFQNPVSSLNPYHRVRTIVAEPLRRAGVPAAEREAGVRALLESVGLDADVIAGRRPREISGGQAQRVSIARALAASPELLIADESVSALDVSVQATVLNVLRQLSEQHGLTIMFISHDLGVVRTVSDDVAVLHLGQLCEVGPSEAVLAAPAHPYTAALRAAVPEPGVLLGDPRIADAEPPSPLNPPSGCSFRERCLLATEICAIERPPLADMGNGRRVACHHPLIPSTTGVLDATTKEPSA